MSNKRFTTNVNDYLVISILGRTSKFIAQVKKTDPLQLKVEENGPHANLKDDDFLIYEEESEQLQNDCRAGTNIYLEKEDCRVLSGLKSLGITDGALHIIKGVKTP